jgi:hypothetical protein
MLFTIIFLEKRNYLYGWAFYGAQGHVPHVINAGFWPVTSALSYYKIKLGV